MKTVLLPLRAAAAATLSAALLAGCGGGYGDSGSSTLPPSGLAAVLTGDQETPSGVATGAFGTASFSLDRYTGMLSGSVSSDGLAPAVAAHIHEAAPGVAGPIIIPLALPAGGSGAITVPAGTFLSAAQMASLDAGKLYVNVHTADNPNGEIRGQIGREVRIARLTPTQETSAVASAASGSGRLVLDPATNALSGEIALQGLTATAAHVHEGAVGVAGPILVTLSADTGGRWVVPAGTTLSAAQAASLRAGALYFNAHSTAFPNGEIRGQIGLRLRYAGLTGAQEVPANASAATGRAQLSYDPATRRISGQLTLSGLSATAAHLHAGGVGVNGPIIVTLQESSPGSGVWMVPAGTTLSADHARALLVGGLYVNAHTAALPDGEIRGQLTLD